MICPAASQWCMAFWGGTGADSAPVVIARYVLSNNHFLFHFLFHFFLKWEDTKRRTKILTIKKRHANEKGRWQRTSPNQQNSLHAAPALWYTPSLPSQGVGRVCRQVHLLRIGPINFGTWPLLSRRWGPTANASLPFSLPFFCPPSIPIHFNFTHAAQPHQHRYPPLTSS